MTDTVFPTGDVRLTPSAGMTLFADDGTKGGFVTATDVLNVATIYAETVYTASVSITLSAIPLAVTVAVLSSATPISVTIPSGAFDGQALHVKRASGAGGAHTVIINADGVTTSLTLNSPLGGEDLSFRWSAAGLTWRQMAFDPGLPLVGSSAISYASTTVAAETIRVDVPMAAVLQSLKYNVGTGGGSFTVTVQSGTTNIGGLTNIPVSSSADTVATPTTTTNIAAGGTLNVVISGVSASPAPTGAFLLLTWKY